MGAVQNSVRGAAWHLAVAVRQNEIVAAGVAGHAATALADRAIHHISAARTDLMRAIQGGGRDLDGLVPGAIADLTRAVSLIDEPIAAAGGAGAAEAAGAAWRVQRQLAARIGDEFPLAGRSLLPRAPLEDRQLIVTADAARMARQTSPWPVADLKEALLTGQEIAPREIVVTPTSTNGAVELVHLQDPGRRGAELAAITKPSTAQAAQDEYGYAMAELIRIDHLVPISVRRQDGSVWIQHLDGIPFWKAGIAGVADLDRQLAADYAAAFPSLQAAEARNAAIADRQALQALDYLIANSDRHHGNGMILKARPTPYYIDHGFAGRGATEDPLVPRLKWFFQGPDGETVLTPSVQHQLGQLLIPGRIDAVHDVLRRPAGVLDARGIRFLGEDTSDAARAALHARARQVADHGRWNYRPLGEHDHALADGVVAM